MAIFTGVGDRAFCAGSDIKANFAEGGLGGLLSAEDSMGGLGGWHLGKVSKIVICAINGHANGGGLEQVCWRRR